jgi:hypothetical protein
MSIAMMAALLRVAGCKFVAAARAIHLEIAQGICIPMFPPEFPQISQFYLLKSKLGTMNRDRISQTPQTHRKKSNAAGRARCKSIVQPLRRLANVNQHPPSCRHRCRCACHVRAGRMQQHQREARGRNHRYSPALGRGSSARRAAPTRHRQIRRIHARTGETATRARSVPGADRAIAIIGTGRRSLSRAKKW